MTLAGCCFSVISGEASFTTGAASGSSARGTASGSVSGSSSNCGDSGLECLLDIGCARSTCAPGDDDLACAVNAGIGFCCQGACHPVDSDPTNCGACGAVCPAGASCADFTCSFACDGGCSEGYGCFERSCSRTDCTGAADGVSCEPIYDYPDVGTCCGGTCVNQAEDPNNCAGCGFKCGEGEFCLLFSCVHYADCASDSPGAMCLLEDGDAGSCKNETCDADRHVGSETCSLDSGYAGVFCDGACVDGACE